MERIGNIPLLRLDRFNHWVVARQEGMDVLAFACVTNKAAGLSKTLLTHEEVMETGRKAQSSLGALIREVLKTL